MQRLRRRNPYGGWNIENLKKAMINIWENEISIELINKFIDFLPERLEGQNEEGSAFRILDLRM
jgi:hypothetical protein